MPKCDLCKKGEVDPSCEIIFNWEGQEKRGPYHTCIFCWDDLQAILTSNDLLPYSGNTLKISLKED